MDERYRGNFIVGLMRTIDTNLRRVENNEDIPEPKVEVGGQIVNVGPLKIRVGPEVIESWKRIEAEKRHAIASGMPYKGPQWQTKNPVTKALMRMVMRKAGFPGMCN